MGPTTDLKLSVNPFLAVGYTGELWSSSTGRMEKAIVVEKFIGSGNLQEAQRCTRLFKDVPNHIKIQPCQNGKYVVIDLGETGYTNIAMDWRSHQMAPIINFTDTFPTDNHLVVTEVPTITDIQVRLYPLEAGVITSIQGIKFLWNQDHWEFKVAQPGERGFMIPKADLYEIPPDLGIPHIVMLEGKAYITFLPYIAYRDNAELFIFPEFFVPEPKVPMIDRVLGLFGLQRK